MKIVACPECHTQYDVTQYAEEVLHCPCGAVVQKALARSREAEIQRCGSCGAAVTAEETHCTYCSSKIERESTRFTLICPECFARNAAASVFCADCGIKFEPQEPPTQESLLQCPCCQDTTMAARVLGGYMVQECPGCRGLWVPEERLDRLVEQAVQAAARRRGPRPERAAKARTMGPVVYRKCPECGGAMQRKNFARRSGVIVDWCGHHGSWLDADELEAIAAYVITEGAGRDWRMYSTDKRFKAIAAQHMPEFSTPKDSVFARDSGVTRRKVVGGDDLAEGFVDWLSDLLSKD